MFTVEYYKITSNPKYLAEHDGDCCQPVKTWAQASFADLTATIPLDTPMRILEFGIAVGEWLAGKNVADWLPPDGVAEGYIRVHKGNPKIK